MKFNIKGLVFVGAAAAIMLSAVGAEATPATKTPHTTTAADTSVVTSKKFTEDTYEHWADKIADVSELTDQNGWADSPDKYPSMNVLSQTLDNLELGDNYQPIVDTVGVEADAENDTSAVVQIGWKASANDRGNWQSLDGDDSGYVIINEAKEGEQNMKHIDLRQSKLVAAPSDVTNANGNKLPLVSAVQPKIDSTDKGKVLIGYQANSQGSEAGWEQLESTTYIDVVHGQNPDNPNNNGRETPYVALKQGMITFKGDSAVAADVDIADVANISDTHASNLTTAWAVKDYVTSVLGGNTLPAMNANCTKVDSHCALVTSWDNTNHVVTMAWQPMAGAEGTGNPYTNP